MIWTAVSGTVKLSGPGDSLTFCVLHECAILSGKEGIKKKLLDKLLGGVTHGLSCVLCCKMPRWISLYMSVDISLSPVYLKSKSERV